MDILSAVPLHQGRACDPADDGELMHRIRASDARALEAAIQRYWAPLVAFAQRMLGWTDGAEDAVQDAFVSLWERRAGWQSSDSLRGLLYSIVRNQTLNEQRRRSVRVRWLAGERRARVGFNPTPLDWLEEDELAVAVRQAIEALPARRREVFALARYHGLSYREIAATMGISSQTVANQMSAAMDELRGALRSFLSEPAAEDTAEFEPGAATRPGVRAGVV